MGKLVIMNDPWTLLLYGMALLFWLPGHYKKVTGGRFILISTAVAIAATAVALLHGASMREAAAGLIVFLLLNMGVSG